MINYRELIKIGLTDKEAKVYYTSLQRGPETAPMLAKLADVVRPTTYVAIESLIEKGLMTTYAKGKKTYYVAEPPEHLLSLIRLKKQEVEEKERQFMGLLPELEAIKNIKGEKPNVRVFEGKEGLNTIIETILKSKTKLVQSFVPYDQRNDLFPLKERREKIIDPRIQKNIKLQIIYTSKDGPAYKRNEPEFLRETLYIDKNEFPFDCGIDIYDNFCNFYTYQSKIMGVVIENEHIAKMMKTLFEMVWEKYK